jgi:glycosyltransferase involved in cell wall biosynthesis
MKRINFITNCSLDNISGGWNGISFRLYESLRRHFEVNYVGSINPRADWPSKLVSKLRRMSGLRGKFHFFSERRLQRIAAEVERRVDPSADFDFYHGLTPWIGYACPRPYGVYMDANFQTYLEIYLNRTQFVSTDVQRICNHEAKWLAKTTHIFCGSQWARNRTVSEYGILEHNFRVVWVGGCAAIPARLQVPTTINFLFISLNFVKKGGYLCADAYQYVRRKYPEATLTFIGQCPPREVLALPGVVYAGFLRKTEPQEAKRFEELLASAFALIHPTTMDANPLVLIEAGYYGCPTITTHDFGIPELVEDGVSGFLIDPPLTAGAFASKMLLLCEDRARYSKMRESARELTTTKLTWEAVARRICDHIEKNGVVSQ